MTVPPLGGEPQVGVHLKRLVVPEHEQAELAQAEPVEAVSANCLQRGTRPLGPAATVKQGDARDLSIPDGSMDLVLTSPPYLNAIDYIRCSKFSLVWMGYSVSALREIRSNSVGADTPSEKSLDQKWVPSVVKQLKLTQALSKHDHGLLVRYVWDMGQALSETARVLRRGGRAVYVVGDSMSRGTFIRNSAIVAAVAREHGLVLASRNSRDLPANRRYLPPPKRGTSNAAMDGRIRREVVLVFDKR